MSDEIIKVPSTPNNIFNPLLAHNGAKTVVKFSGRYLKQDEDTFSNTEKTVNIYIAFEITKKSNVSSYPTLENCLFGSVKLTKNPHIDKYKYSGYDIGFGRKEKFSIGYGFGQNVIIFGAGMSSSAHANNKKKYFNSW